MTVNVERASTKAGSVTDLNGKDLSDAIEEIKLHQEPIVLTPRRSMKKIQTSTDSNSSKSSNGKSSFFSFKKKTSKDHSNEKSFSSKMRKFVSNGNQNNAKAPVSRRKKKLNKESGESDSQVSRSSSEPALNQQPQPQEAFVKEAPSMSAINQISSKKGRKKTVFRKKSRNSVLPTAGSNSASNSGGKNGSAGNILQVQSRDPVFSTDVRTQNTKLVTPRQRQEIYALNRVMTRLENEKFKRFCHEKGYKGDRSSNTEKDVVEYDIFM